MRRFREQLLDCCALDWSAISPAIFGAMFQSIMDARARRNLGAHYTSEENILKLIRPLFLDDLWAEFEKVKGNRNRLFEFHKKLRGLNFLDPACGCGNFLVITYRELRKLELEVLRAAYGGGQQTLDVHTLTAIDVDQFHGIEIEEFPAQIAQVALWLIDHQMNVRVSEEFGHYYARIPLKASPHIVHGNALRIDWADVIVPERCGYVLGNPPFVGSKLMDEGQRRDADAVFEGVASAGLLDFVAAWYVRATRYMRASNAAHPACAFVSTNSITQREQVVLLWGWLMAQGVRIRFAHRTFQWNNEASGVAAVDCVIIGFGLDEPAQRTIFEYDDIRGQPHGVSARNINPYLLDAPDVLAVGRRVPLCHVSPMVNGSIPADGGHLILDADERSRLLDSEPTAARFIRPYVGAEDFLHGIERYCLWLVDCPPAELRRLPTVMERVKRVQAMRQSSSKAATRAKAATPSLFTEDRQPSAGHYLAIPRTSSESRKVLPVGYLPHTTIAANDLQLVPQATRFEFGVLSSAMHLSWVHVTAGRLESRLRYSAKYTYNTFPWPDPTDAQRAAVEAAAQGVLDARAQFHGATLADLYDPLAMPPALLQAHRRLDAAVDAAYVSQGGKRSWRSDAERVAFLFDRYAALTSLLPVPAVPAKRARRGRGAAGAVNAPAA